jgi:ubiquitin carboxyl-terminal hydrolase 5/13
MGFPTIRCKKALLANPGNPDAAVQWLFEHMDDPDIDAPLATTSSVPPADPAMISMLQDMGFTAPQARKALRETVSTLIIPFDLI